MIKIGKILKKSGFNQEIVASLDLKPNLKDLERKITFLHIELEENYFIPFRVNEIEHLGENEYLILFDRMQESDVTSILQKIVFIPEEQSEHLVSKNRINEEIIGLELMDGEHAIGIIEDFYDVEPHPLLVVYIDEKEVLIPFVEEWILGFDGEQGKLYMELPDGLLDI